MNHDELHKTVQEFLRRFEAAEEAGQPGNGDDSTRLLDLICLAELEYVKWLQQYDQVPDDVKDEYVDDRRQSIEEFTPLLRKRLGRRVSEWMWPPEVPELVTVLAWILARGWEQNNWELVAGAMLSLEVLSPLIFNWTVE